MHKNIKRSVSFFMSFLIFCQIGGYSGAKVPENVKSSSDLSFGQKIKAFFNTTIPDHPGETAGVCGGVGLLTAIGIALGITKPWKHKQEQGDATGDLLDGSGSPSTLHKSLVAPKNESSDDDSSDADSDDTSSLLDGQPVGRARGCSADSVRLNGREEFIGRPRSKSESNVFNQGAGFPTSFGDTTNYIGADDPTATTTTATVFTTVPIVKPDSSDSPVAAPSGCGVTPVDRVPSPQNLPPSVLQQHSAAAPSEVRSPSPEELKLAEGLQIELSSDVKKRMEDFCNSVRLSRAPNSAARQCHDVYKTEEFIKFLAQIENKRFDSKNLSSLIESNAIRCQQLHIIQMKDPLRGVGNCSDRLKPLSIVINPFAYYVAECDFSCIDPQDKAGSHDWTVFKDYLLHNLIVVDDAENPNHKMVILKPKSTHKK